MRKGWYDSEYNDGKFVPYNSNEFAAEEADPFEVITVKVDNRTHYRIARTREGEALYAMMRRLSDDGRFYRRLSMPSPVSKDYASLPEPRRPSASGKTSRLLRSGGNWTLAPFSKEVCARRGTDSALPRS